MIGKKVMVGGFEKVFDCVGSDKSVDESLRFTKQSGTMILVGLAAIPKGVDWTPIWLKEIKLTGAYCYSMEVIDGIEDSTYRHALRLIETGLINTSALVTHIFDITDYAAAIEAASNKRQFKSTKVLFKF